MAKIQAVTSEGTHKDLRATQDAELIVRAIQEEEIEHFSGLGQAFSWWSTATDIDAGDTILFVKNTSDYDLVLDRAVFSGSNVICNYHVGIGAATTTPAGTALTAVNLNENFSSKTFDYLAYHDETAVDDASVLMDVWTPVTNTVQVTMKGIVLGKNHYVQINQETESTSGSVTLFAHFTDEIA